MSLDEEFNEMIHFWVRSDSYVAMKAPLNSIY